MKPINWDKSNPIVSLTKHENQRVGFIMQALSGSDELRSRFVDDIIKISYLSKSQNVSTLPLIDYWFERILKFSKANV
jgi:hypothetical protein